MFTAVLVLCCCMVFSLVAVSGGCSLAVACRFLISVASLVTERGLQGPRASVVVFPGPESTGSVVVAHGCSGSSACGIFLDQGLNPCLLLWQVDSLPVSHQGSPGIHSNLARSFILTWQDPPSSTLLGSSEKGCPLCPVVRQALL